MEYKVVYWTDKRPHIKVMIGKVSDGVWLIYCDFFECLSNDGCGSDSDGWDSIYFGDEDEILIEVKYKPNTDGYLFGELSKKTYHGTFYEYWIYDKIMNENR